MKYQFRKYTSLHQQFRALNSSYVFSNDGLFDGSITQDEKEINTQCLEDLKQLDQNKRDY